jgi:elongation factor Ts
MSLELVKELREKTGAGLVDCQKALAEAAGDIDKALRVLREKGLAKAAKKAGRAATDGAVGAYVHPGSKIGVLIEVNCETDFVAKTPEFQGLVKDLAMQVAATAPRYVARDEVPPAEVESERAIYRKQAEASGKPAQVVELGLLDLGQEVVAGLECAVEILLGVLYALQNPGGEGVHTGPLCCVGRARSAFPGPGRLPAGTPDRCWTPDGRGRDRRPLPMTLDPQPVRMNARRVVAIDVRPDRV